MDVTVLCKVVDNYGDLGVVYRLARALSALSKDLSLRIITDNLLLFSKLAPGIDPGKKVQHYNGWQLYDWNAGVEDTAAFTAEPPHTILECFQCGRPDWLETLLFTAGVPDIVHIINLEYLTAEPYADDFHCLQSLTRSVRVQKVNFMPGFTGRTGGLILDEPFVSRLSFYIQPPSVDFTVLVFSYPRDFTVLVRALALFQTDLARKQNPQTLNVNLASGISAAPFRSAWEAAGRPFPVTQLPFMEQTAWDRMLCVQSFLFIRGEDSLSRACLSGIPFVWHAYPQENNYQKVKVQALLDRMRPFFEPASFILLENYWSAYNTPEEVSVDPLPLFRAYEVLSAGFRAFSRSLFENGDLAAHLLSYITKQLN
jgi:uncharacterized repeat protein (TIGR03837 family)